MPRRKKVEGNLWDYNPEDSFQGNIENAKKYLAKFVQSVTANQKSKWGPLFWTIMHSICANYPTPHTQQDINALVSLFDAILTHIPCAACKAHFISFIRSYNHTIEELAQRGYLTLNVFLWLAHNNATKYKNMDNRIKAKHKLWTWRECVLRWGIKNWEFPEAIRKQYEDKGLY